MNATTIALAVSLSITPQLATTVQQTIRGDYGNGIERVHNLGQQYDAVQRAINKYYSQHSAQHYAQHYADTTPTPQHATTTHTPPATTWHDGYQPCEYEDGSGQTSCYWDATTFGNHKGRSYIIENGQTHYIN